ncbi:MAG TPA: bifunctional UDP-N-acetylglucosamine diphosphorylase/glucosamine-1-phosphate N-acetyltransferase GlmU [Stellaceae bacterium]|nr:bifunctional UDP-N-acetylglucosamine diphosphorylase/glucosamine-1-phosphate N-acetyltransferase GlmU [Stellaceae bacterium]
MTLSSLSASLPGCAAIVLAAGEGTRMKSALPKVLHEVAGRPMIAHVLAALEPLAPVETVVVVGQGQDAVAKAVAPAKTATQHPPRGTGDAVKAARPVLEPSLANLSDVIILFGDAPLLQSATIARLIAARRTSGAAIAVAGMRPADPSPYGRLVLGADGGVERIVEAKDARPDEAAITLCNGGIMAVAAKHLFDLVDRLENINAKREFYLTDIVGIARRHDLAATYVELPAEEVLGVNTRAELAQAEGLMQDRLRQRAMADGATLIAPGTVFFSADTRLGRDVVVEPNVVFGPGVSIADNVRIRAFSHLDGATIDERAIVGPYARLRPGAVLERDVHVGNFVEVKATRLGAGAKANHLSYLGDSDIGAETNIGAGTITCNYDGFNKHRTIIGKGAFIGSDSALVAPVTIGDGAYVATGSVITADVPADALSIARARQVDKPGRAAELRARLKGKK